MTDASRQILEQVRQLSPLEQQELLAELQRAVQPGQPSSNGCSILELDGLGRDIWASVDVGEYVLRERHSWNG